MAVELGTGYVSLTASAKGIGNSIAKEIGAPLAKEGEAAGKRASSGFVSTFKAGLGGLKTVAIGAFAGIAAGGAVIGGLAKIGGDFDEAFDKIRVGTGATGKSLKGLETVTKSVFSSVPTSLGDASDAVTDLNQKLGLSGKPLQDLSTQFINLSRTTGTDLKGNISSVAGLFNQFGVSAGQQGTKLDELFRVSQKTGISVGDLAGQMSQSGPVFKTAGFSFEQSASLLGLLGKNGLSVSDVLPSISKSLAVAAKSGKPAQQVFKDTFAAIKGAPNDTKAAGIALDVFGAKAGPKFAALIRSGQLSYEDFATTIAAGGDTINTAATDTDDWREKLQILKNKALVAIEPIASRVFSGLTTGIEKVTTVLPKLGQFFKDAFGFLQAGFTGAAGEGQGFFGFMARVGGAARTVVDVFKENWPKIKAIAGDVFDKIKTAGAVVLDIVKKIGQFAKDNTQTVIAFVAALAGLLILNEIAKAIAAVNVVLAANPFVLVAVAIAALVAGVIYAYFHFQRFRDIVDTVISFFRDKVGPAFKTAAQAIVTAFQAVISFFQDHWTGITQIVNGVFTAIKLYILVTLGAIKLQIQIFIAVVLGIWSVFGGAIKTVISTTFNFIKGYITGTLNIIRGVITVITALIHGDWGKAWDGVKQILLGVWQQMKAIVQNALGLIKAGIQAAWAAVKALTQAAWTAMKAIVSAQIQLIVAVIRRLPGLAVSALSALGSSLVRVGSSALGKMKDAVTTGARNVVTEIGKIPGQAVSALGDVGSKLAHVGTAMIEGIASGIRGAAGAIASAFHSVGFHYGGSHISVLGKTITLVPAFDFHLAHGGVTNGPVNALLGDNPSGREAVIPLAANGARNFNRFLAGIGRNDVHPAPQPIVIQGNTFIGPDRNTLGRWMNETLAGSQRNGGVQITFKAA